MWGRAGRRFVAVQLAGSATPLALAAMSFAFDHASSIHLAVTFGMLALPASLLYALVLVALAVRQALAFLCLFGAVLSVWLGCFGVIRMRSALDRLHAVTFVNVAGGGFLAAAGMLTAGVSARSVKLVALAILVLVTG